MHYRIIADGEVIGFTGLETCDVTLGVLSGVFAPAIAYERVRAVFRLYTDAGTSLLDQDAHKLQAYFAARDVLDLRVETEEGIQLPISTVHVDDFSVETGEYQVTVWTDNVGAFESCNGADGYLR